MSLISKIAHARRWLRAPYRYVGEEWPGEGDTGWNVESVADAYRAAWPAFVKSLCGTAPLTLGEPSIWDHNAIGVFNYALARTAAERGRRLSILDWGGGMGQYYLRAKAALPGLEIEYHCKDVPLLIEAGRSLQPHVHFYDDDTCLDRTFDFVLASGSLQYSEDWTDILDGLGTAVGAGGYLLVTRTPMHTGRPDFVYDQGAYGARYHSWSIERDVFLATAADTGVELVREFLIETLPEPIIGAPAASILSAFLFARPL